MQKYEQHKATFLQLTFFFVGSLLSHAESLIPNFLNVEDVQLLRLCFPLITVAVALGTFNLARLILKCYLHDYSCMRHIYNTIQYLMHEQYGVLIKIERFLNLIRKEFLIGFISSKYFQGYWQYEVIVFVIFSWKGELPDNCILPVLLSDKKSIDILFWWWFAWHIY